MPGKGVGRDVGCLEPDLGKPPKLTSRCSTFPACGRPPDATVVAPLSSALYQRLLQDRFWPIAEVPSISLTPEVHKTGKVKCYPVAAS